MKHIVNIIQLMVLLVKDSSSEMELSENYSLFSEYDAWKIPGNNVMCNVIVENCDNNETCDV